MIKDLLQQLAPLDAQIAALRGNAAGEDERYDRHHRPTPAELAELAAQEDAMPSALRAADRRGPGLSGPASGSPPHRRDRQRPVYRFL